jgi:hypothetical protein
MASKKSKLIARSQETARFPVPRRLEVDLVKPKGYRVIAVSLYNPEADWLDKAASALQGAGNPKANRSLVVREAILRLQEETKSKTPSEMLRDFSDRQARRSKQNAS